MKKTTTHILKALTFSIVLVMMAGGAQGATYYLRTVARADLAGSWYDTQNATGGTAAGNFTTSGDLFIIKSTTTDAVFASTSTTIFETGVTLQVEGKFTLGIGDNNKKTYLTINGTIKFTNTSATQAAIPTAGNPNTITSFTLGANANLITANANGIAGTNCSISTLTAGKAIVTLPTDANYEFNGGNQTTTGLPAMVNNLTLSGSGIKTLAAATTVSNTLTIGSGVTLAQGTYALNLQGDLINSGNAFTGSAAFTLGGTKVQSIAGFSTSGSVSMTKTSNAATFTGPVTAVGLTINGTGGTLNLGTGLTHTFSGTWTRTAGTLNGGTSTLKLGGALSGAGGTFTANGGTVDYYGAAQTIAPLIYNNLTLSGSGSQTSTGVTVNGILSMEGTATISTAPSYGGAATLQYNTATARTVGLEWPATFSGTGGVIIKNTGAITLNVAKIVDRTLNINSGATLITNNNDLTLKGNFTQDGTFTAGSSAIILFGTSLQSIAGFSTSGKVTMAKTGSTATFTGNVSAGSLTIDGSGGTLNLGAGLTHTINGTLTRTNGTLNGGSSTLRLGNDVSGTGGTFTAGTGTVEFNGTGVQTIPALTYNNLTLSGTGSKTFSNAVTVNGTLTNSSASTISSTLTATAGTIDNNTGGSITMATGGSLSGTTFNNDGTITASDGTINVSGNLTNTNAINISSSGTLTAGTIQNNAGGTISKTSTNTLTWPTLSNAGTITASAGTINVSGNLTNTNAINLSSALTAGTVQNNAGGTITMATGGSLSQTTLNNTGTITCSAGTIAVSGTLTNAAAINLSSTLTAGTIDNNATGTITMATGGSSSQTTLNNAGTITCSAGTIAVSGTLTNAAAINLSSTLTAGTIDNNAAGTITMATGGSLSGTTLSNAGTITAPAGAIDVSGTLTNSNAINLSSTGSLTVGSNLTNSGALSMTGGTINLAGTFTPGTFAPTGGTVVYNGGNQNINSLTYKTLNIEGSGIKTLTGAVTATDLTIASGTNLTVEPTGKLTIDNALTNSAGAAGLLLVSDKTTGTGSLIIKGTVTGLATVERAMTPTTFHLIAPPVADQDISQFLSANTSIASYTLGSETYRAMRDYDAENNGWYEFFLSTKTGTLDNGKGYGVRVKNSVVTHDVTFTGTPRVGTVTLDGLIPERWNCIGNPYTSAIAIFENGAGGSNNFIGVNTEKFADPFKAVYVWDPVEGAYEVINHANSLKQLAQGQAFMINLKQHKTDVEFNSDMQVHLPALALKSTDGVWPTVELVAMVDSIKSSTLITFNEEMTAGLDPGYDAGFLSGDNPLEVNTLLVEDYGIPFAVQALPTLGNETVVVPVNIESDKAGQVSFSAIAQYLPSSYSVSLEDRQSNTITPLGTQSYSAELMESGSAAGRFFLHISNTTTGMRSPTKQPLFKAWSSAANEITIQGSVSNGATATILDVQGRLIVTHVLSKGNSHRIGLPSVRPGIYLIKVTDSNKVHATKVVINQ